MSDDCLFCRILAGEIPSETVLEDDTTYAFRDIDPQAPTHVLVIPRRHVPTLAGLAAEAPEEAVAVLRTVQAVADAEGIGDAYRMVTNNGADAQQSVFHAHAHVLGGRGLTWPPG